MTEKRIGQILIDSKGQFLINTPIGLIQPKTIRFSDQFRQELQDADPDLRVRPDFFKHLIVEFSWDDFAAEETNTGEAVIQKAIWKFARVGDGPFQNWPLILGRIFGRNELRRGRC